MYWFSGAKTRFFNTIYFLWWLFLQITIDRDDMGKQATSPKHGRVDPTGNPHVGGNTWAGGTGGTEVYLSVWVFLSQVYILSFFLPSSLPIPSPVSFFPCLCSHTVKSCNVLLPPSPFLPPAISPPSVFPSPLSSFLVNSTVSPICWLL